MDPILLALALTLQKDILLPEILLKDVTQRASHSCQLIFKLPTLKQIGNLWLHTLENVEGRTVCG